MNSNITNTPKLAHPVAPVAQKTKAVTVTTIPPESTGLTPSVLDAAQAQWADKINLRLRDGLEALIEAGPALIDAKEALPHGSFGAMLKSGFLKIDQRTAERLMHVAGHPALSNSTNWSKLPQSIQSLDVLAKLDESVIEQAIKAGEITPAMTITDAGDFVRSKLDAPPKKARKAAAAAPADAPEPESPSVADDVTPAQSERFDAQVFKAALTQFLEREYAKAPRACAGEMQAAVAAACSEFFASRTAIPSQSTGQIGSVLHVDGTLEANDVALPPSETQEGRCEVKQAAAKSSGTTTASSITGDAVPIFRKNYPLSHDDRSRLVQDLSTLKSTEPSCRAYNDALRRVVDAGHYLAVAGSLDAFCAEFLLRDVAEVKLALEGEQSASQSKQSELPPTSPVQIEPPRRLSLKEQIALSKQAARVTA